MNLILYGVEIVVLLLAFLMVILVFVGKDRKGGLHWYPEHVKQAAIERSLITEKELQRRSKQSRLLGLFVLLIVIVGSVFFVNQTTEFWSAFLQMAGMILIMNWFDAYFVDYVWVRKTKYWIIPELADIKEIGKPVRQILRERIFSSIFFLCVALLLSCISFLR